MYLYVYVHLYRKESDCGIHLIIVVYAIESRSLTKGYTHWKTFKVSLSLFNVALLVI